MILNELFENTIYPDMKEYVLRKSLYNPNLDDCDTYPYIKAKILNISNKYNSLSYDEEIFEFTINVDIFSKDTETESKNVICDEITKHIIDYYKSNYRVTIKVTFDLENEQKAYKNNIQIMGKLDTKYGLNNLVIYPI